jgi:hypothetical protein
MCAQARPVCLLIVYLNATVPTILSLRR